LGHAVASDDAPRLRIGRKSFEQPLQPGQQTVAAQGCAGVKIAW
jgi:hypothetical protein